MVWPSAWRCFICWLASKKWRKMLRDGHQSTDFSFWAARRVMVTGAAGTIGSGVVRELLQAGAGAIVCVDRAETPLAELQEFLLSQKSHSHTIYLADIEDEPKLDAIFKAEHPDIVIHCAALKHVPFLEGFPEEALATNFYATKILAGLAEKYGIDRFVTVSTDKAVEPANIMGYTKRLAEVEMRFRHMSGTATQFIAVRFGNVLGSNGSFSKKLESRLQPGAEVEITDPEVSRYMMSVKEACVLLLTGTVSGKGGEILVYDMGKPVKIVALLDHLLELKGIPKESIRIRYTGLRPGDKLSEKLFYDFELPFSVEKEKIHTVGLDCILPEEVDLLAKFAEHRLRGSLSGASYEMLTGELARYAAQAAKKPSTLPE